MNRIEYLWKSTFVGSLVLLASISLFALPAVAQAPPQLLQQGRLLDDAGEPMTGDVVMEFSIYDAPSEGATLWQSEFTVSVDETGFYSAVLGAHGTPLTADVFSQAQTWIGIAVDGGEELSPRFQLQSVPYSLSSARSERAAVADQVADGAITRDALASDVLDDTLAAISCAPGEVPISSASGWDCGNIEGLTLAEVEEAVGTSLGSLNCGAGEIVRFDGSQWGCELGSDIYLETSGGTMHGDLVVQEFEILKLPDNSVETRYRERKTTRLVVRNQRRRETVMIPRERLDEICGDGCTYTIAMRYWRNENVELGSRGPHAFSYDGETGRWRNSNNNSGVSGDGSLNHVQNVGGWNCCYFTEAEYIAGSNQGDTTRDMFLLNNSSSTCPLNDTSSLECILTFYD